MSTHDLAGTIALVTGASSGIGRATARILGGDGAHVVAVGRRLDRLEELVAEVTAAGGSAEAAVADLASPGASAALVDGIAERHGRLDLVVNAAGVMLSGPSIDSPADDWQAMIDINLTGLVHLTKAALPHLVASAATSGRGVVDLVNVSSLSGRIATAENAVYAATKFGVVGFTDAIRREFTRKNVRVSVIEPALVQTEIFGHQREAGQRYFEQIREGIEILLPEDVAEVIEFVVTRPRRVGVNEIVVKSIEQL
ncbi:MAG: short-chain dehydrogenase/reductase [Frondihabitans sp.]|nr:short-chain dehydrogenase/reductase [Frondihabitans sp.]